MKKHKKCKKCLSFCLIAIILIGSITNSFFDYKIKANPVVALEISTDLIYWITGATTARSIMNNDSNALKNDCNRLARNIEAANEANAQARQVVAEKADSLIGLLTTAGYVVTDKTLDSVIEKMEQAEPVEQWPDWNDHNKEVEEENRKALDAECQAHLDWLLTHPFVQTGGNDGGGDDDGGGNNEDKWIKLANKLGKICNKATPWLATYFGLKGTYALYNCKRRIKRWI